ncbi:MAG: DUF4133 domain-containing protein [Bacteroidota bacterium]
MATVYEINKGVNKPILFKGLKAQYIAYLAGGLVALLLLFAVLYLCGLNTFGCLFIVGGMGTALFVFVFRFSHRYGQYGLMKRSAKRRMPVCLRFSSRRVFKGLLGKV